MTSRELGILLVADGIQADASDLTKGTRNQRRGPKTGSGGGSPLPRASRTTRARKPA
jgi:hypothetical protein